VRLEDLEIAAGAERLTVRASLPDDAAPPAVVAISSASGDLDDAPLLDHLHAFLPDAGIAAISTREHPRLDRATVVELLGRVRSSGAVDPARVGLWAFGESTRLAIVTAAVEPRAAFAILVSPSAVTPARRLAYATARVMRALGARDALNLDGGGSTTLSIGGQLANRPSDATGERPVGDAILLKP
jgi:hypothetical protein